MKALFHGPIGMTWAQVRDLCRHTMSKEDEGKEPSPAWIKRLLLAEHSPIREIRYLVELVELPTWISTHLVRHKIGVEHYVTSRRPDRTGKERSILDTVDHKMALNAQALIYISRKRLCTQAASDTREAWDLVCGCLPKELQQVLVPDCVYRNECFELKPCGWANTEAFKRAREVYIDTTGHKGL